MTTAIANAATAQAAPARRMMADYNRIVDDGDCIDHGYILPKQNAKKYKSVCNCGVAIVDVSNKALLAGLADDSKQQQLLVAAIK